MLHLALADNNGEGSWEVTAKEKVSKIFHYIIDYNDGSYHRCFIIYIWILFIYV
jgi:uncharacterized protein YpmB